MRIEMFTKTVCPTCKVAKQQLSYLPVPVEIKEYNIEEDIYIDKDGQEHSALAYLSETLDSMSTPTFLFEDGDVIRGYEEGKLREKLGL
ncbi:hypothetical protein A6E27_22840 [Bacillus cereus]|nr:hypothetical protein A6E27_22840 [Bacillus cereus]